MFPALLAVRSHAAILRHLWPRDALVVAAVEATIIAVVSAVKIANRAAQPKGLTLSEFSVFRRLLDDPGPIKIDLGCTTCTSSLCMEHHVTSGILVLIILDYSSSSS